VQFYGTYLIYQIQQLFLKEKALALPVNEIAARLHTYEESREQYNFERRVRKAVSLLESNGFLKKELQRRERNLFHYLYKLSDNEQGNEPATSP
jgi:predicted transcriptional regulator